MLSIHNPGSKLKEKNSQTVVTVLFSINVGFSSPQFHTSIFYFLFCSFSPFQLMKCAFFSSWVWGLIGVNYYRESLIKVPEPSILPFFKPIDYVGVLAQIHKELESCPPQERSNLYLSQFQVFRGLGEFKLMRRSLRAAWQRANSVHEKLVFGAWLKYEKKGEEIIADLLTTCSKYAEEFGPIDVASHLPFAINVSSQERILMNGNHISRNVTFTIGNEKIICDRQKISELSPPFHAMLNGYFSESHSETIDLSANNISPSGLRAIRDYSLTGSLNDVPPNLLLEILVFANKYCCEGLRDACDRRLASKEDAVELIEYALEENSPVLASSCLQVLLRDLPNCLNDNRVVEIFIYANRQQLAVMVGSVLFSLYCLLIEASMNLNPVSDRTADFPKRLVDFSLDFSNGDQQNFVSKAFARIF